jgi:hypothetical protein
LLVVDADAVIVDSRITRVTNAHEGGITISGAAAVLNTVNVLVKERFEEVKKREGRSS